MSDSNRGWRDQALAEKGEATDRGNQGTEGRNQDTQEQAAPIPVAIEKSASANEPIKRQNNAEGQKADPYGPRDIVAQETMADASVVMAVAAILTFFVTLAGTILIWRQVCLTRKAVKDTGYATSAMNKANEIAIQAQRPWLSIDINLLEFTVTGHSYTLSCEAIVTNVGKMVAERCIVRTAFITDDKTPEGQAKIENIRKVAASACRGELPKGQTPYPMLPGQSEKFGMMRNALGFEWRDDDGQISDAAIMVFVAARYFIAGEDVMRETDRAFCLTYERPSAGADEKLWSWAIPYPIPDDLSAESVDFRPAGHNRTT